MRSMDDVTLEDIERAHTLFGTDFVLIILDGLGRGLAPSRALPYGAEPKKIMNALAMLAEWDLITITPSPGTPPADRSVALTPRGARLVSVLDDIS